MNRLRWILMFVGLLFLIAACTAVEPVAEMTPTVSPTPRSSATPKSTATAIPTPTTAPYLLIDESTLKGVTVRFWHPFTNDAATQLRQMVNDFNSENPYGIRVQDYSLGAGSALQERMENELARNPAEAKLPNVIAGSNLLLQSWADALQPLDGYLSQVDWGLAQNDLADVDALALEQGQTNGTQIALPMLWNAPVLYLNQTWAEELGYPEPPQTFAEFSAIACAAQAALLVDPDQENNGTGGWIVSTDENSVLSWLRGYGFEDLSPVDGKFRFDTPPSEAAFLALWTLNQQGCAWISRQPTPYNYFATRRAVLFSGSLRDVDTVQRALALAGSTDEWVILPYPGVSGSPALLWESSGIALTQGSPEEQLAGWLFLSWLMDSKNQALLSISTHSLPVRESALPWMQVYLEKYPQWAVALDWPLAAESLPLHPNWMSAGNLLEDAAWQLFQPYTKAEDISLILQQLDEMVMEYENGAE